MVLVALVIETNSGPVATARRIPAVFCCYCCCRRRTLLLLLPVVTAIAGVGAWLRLAVVQILWGVVSLVVVRSAYPR